MPCSMGLGKVSWTDVVNQDLINYVSEAFAFGLSLYLGSLGITALIDAVRGRF